MKLDPLANLTAPASERAFSRQANRPTARRHRSLMTEVDQMAHFTHEGVAAAKCVWIDHLNEDRGGPRRRRLRASVTGQSRRQRFDDQREREALVAELETTERQHRTRSVS